VQGARQAALAFPASAVKKEKERKIIRAKPEAIMFFILHAWKTRGFHVILQLKKQTYGKPFFRTGRRNRQDAENGL
jgi:hypothetical protein